VFLTRTNVAMRTRSTAHIQEGFADAHIPVLLTQLHEREAFRVMFPFKQTLEKPESADVDNIDKAVVNAQQLAAEWSSFSE